MKVKRFLQVAILALLLLGCSRIKFVYNQLDWLIPYYFETYMELTDEQSVYFEGQVKELLIWHCRIQLPGYAKWLRSANSILQSEQMTRNDLEKLSGQLEQIWKSLLRQVIPVLSQLLFTANDEQIMELFNRFDERNLEWLEEYRAHTDTERRNDYQERMDEELVRWFGPLNKAQRLKIKKWAGRFRPLGMEGLEMRKKWQAELRGLLHRRNDKSAFTLSLEGLFLRPEQFRSSTYQKRLDENRKVTMDLLYQVGTLLNNLQREHLADQVVPIATDFEELACKDDDKVKLGLDKPAVKSTGLSYSEME